MRRWLLALVLGLVSAAAAAAGYRIERVEPASWWVGMKNSRLQLLVHGEGIAALEPSVSDARASLYRVTRTANPNYLFIDLLVAPGAAPGRFDIAFRQGRQDSPAPAVRAPRASGGVRGAQGILECGRDLPRDAGPLCEW